MRGVLEGDWLAGLVLGEGKDDVEVEVVIDDEVEAESFDFTLDRSSMESTDGSDESDVTAGNEGLDVELGFMGRFSFLVNVNRRISVG